METHLEKIIRLFDELIAEIKTLQTEEEKQKQLNKTGKK